MVAREHRLNVNMSAAEWKMVVALAKDAGADVSDFTRSVMRRMYLERFGDRDLLKAIEDAVLDLCRNGFGACHAAGVRQELRALADQGKLPGRVREAAMALKSSRILELVQMSNLVEERDGKLWPQRRR